MRIVVAGEGLVLASGERLALVLLLRGDCVGDLSSLRSPLWSWCLLLPESKILKMVVNQRWRRELVIRGIDELLLVVIVRASSLSFAQHLELRLVGLGWLFGADVL